MLFTKREREKRERAAWTQARSPRWISPSSLWTEPWEGRVSMPPYISVTQGDDLIEWDTKKFV